MGSPDEIAATPGWDSPEQRTSGAPMPEQLEGVCEPQAHGYWRRQCQKDHPSGESALLPDYVAPVSVVEPFTDVATVEDMCDRLDPMPSSDRCERAEAEFMTLLMNRASGRIDDTCCVGGSGTGTVGDAVTAISTLLGNTARTEADCRLAESLATDVNGDTGPCPEEPAPDAGVPDAALPDAALPDAAPDAAAPDAAL